MENSPIQGNDPRLNNEKPKSTWQKYQTVEGILTVHVSNEETSPIYYHGIPDGYKGGAVYREELAEDFVGDPIEATEE